MRILPVLALITIAACGTKKPAHQILHVDIRGMKYVPDSLAVRVGDTVEWTNDDFVPHTVTSSAFDSKSIAPHSTWSYIATTPGDFAYNCTFHLTMVGAIIVR
ncbi:MAG: cupredoxin domain-containing protein [Kofleriaceae bacterium]